MKHMENKMTAQTKEMYTWPHFRTINQLRTLFPKKRKDLISPLNFYSFIVLSHIQFWGRLPNFAEFQWVL